MVSLAVAPLLLAFVITVVEMTEVVALIFALRSDSGGVRHGVLGAVAGTSAVALVAVGAGAALLRVPPELLLGAAAIALLGFGVVLFRSTLRSYRRARAPAPAPSGPAASNERAVQFGSGFTFGAIEATETVIVLLSITAAGEGASAVAGALAGGLVLVLAALLVHERIRRIKVPTLKLFATSLLFTYATFLAGEALGLAWPFGDLFLLPLFVVAFFLVAGAIGYLLGPLAGPVQTKG